MTPVLEIKDLRAHFYTRRGIVKAVDGVSFKVHKGETLGIVGESGSGKSVCQMSYLGLLPSPPLRILGGEARFGGGDLLKMSAEELRAIRGNRISVIFQEPMTSLNPYLKIGTQLMEPLQIHKNQTPKEAMKHVEEALERVGISRSREAWNAYPHEFSGGMRQRVMIAMALTTRPEVLIADEPTTALDVTVQAQILEILKNLQKETGMAIVMITHDLGVIAGIADRVAVMYAGRNLEEGTAEQLFYESHNPYTQALLRSTPRLDKDDAKLAYIGGTPPDLSRLGDGCPFVDRCDKKMTVCSTQFPEGKKLGADHISYCHLEGR